MKTGVKLWGLPSLKATDGSDDDRKDEPSPETREMILRYGKTYELELDESGPHLRLVKSETSV